MQKYISFFSLLIVFAFVFVSCGRDKCNVPIGVTNFSIEPNSAYYSGLNNVGGYMYFTGGYLGVVVVRTSYNSFVAFERACPEDNATQVVISEEWGSSILQCPKCGSCFIVEADGMPMDGSVTSCPLYQYSTHYSGGVLSIY